MEILNIVICKSNSLLFVLKGRGGVVGGEKECGEGGGRDGGKGWLEVVGREGGVRSGWRGRKAATSWPRTNIVLVNIPRIYFTGSAIQKFN